MCRYFKYAGHLKIWISYIDGKTWKWVGAWLKSYIKIKSIFFPKGLSHDPDPSGYILTESAYFILRFCYKTMKQKSDKLIWKFWNRKKVITGGLGLGSVTFLCFLMFWEIFFFSEVYRKSIGILGTCKTVRTPPPQQLPFPISRIS